MSKTLIHQYDSHKLVFTPLNPIEDISSWIGGLRSQGYVGDLMKEIHGINKSSEISRGTKLTKLYSENALGLLDQAYSGPAEVSFLPLYYCVLNLSKIYAAISGRSSDLTKHRFHGATYHDRLKNSKCLHSDRIRLSENGALPLLYEVITGNSWSWNGRIVKMSDIYKFVQGISFEYKEAYKVEAQLKPVRLIIEGNANDGFKISAEVFSLDRSKQVNDPGLRRMKALVGFHSVQNSNGKYETKPITSQSEEAARASLMKHVRRYLLYGIVTDLTDEPYGCHIPISGSTFILPQEIPIWIAFFHLSNVVRYKPDFMAKLRDSISWPMLLCFRKHSMLDYMVLFWSFLHQTTYLIRTG